MKDSCFIIFNRKKIVRTTVGRPALNAGEHAVRVAVSVPDSAFADDFPVAFVKIPVHHPNGRAGRTREGPGKMCETDEEYAARSASQDARYADLIKSTDWKALYIASRRDLLDTRRVVAGLRADLLRVEKERGRLIAEKRLLTGNPKAR